MVYWSFPIFSSPRMSFLLQPRFDMCVFVKGGGGGLGVRVERLVGLIALVTGPHAGRIA